MIPSCNATESDREANELVANISLGLVLDWLREYVILESGNPPVFRELAKLVSLYYLYLCDQGSSIREGPLIDSANRSNIEYATTVPVTFNLLPKVCPRWMLLSRVMLLSSSLKRTACATVPGTAEIRITLVGWMCRAGSSVPSQPASIRAAFFASHKRDSQAGPAIPSDQRSMDRWDGWNPACRPAVMTCRGQPSRPDPVERAVFASKGRAFRGIIIKLHL